MNLEDLERLLHARLDAIGPAPRAALLYVLKLPDHERARRIAKFYDDPRTQTFAKLLIDLEESPHSRAVVLSELRERELGEGLVTRFTGTSAVGRIPDVPERRAHDIVEERLRGVE